MALTSSILMFVMTKKDTTKSFVLRLNADVMTAVEKWAADEFRSTNGQLQWIITESLRKNRRLPKHNSSATKRTDAEEEIPNEAKDED